MIELGKIPIKDETSMVESRNKIRLLAEDLKFDSIGATRLATITSELSRIIYQKGKESSITVGFDEKKGAFGLLLIFHSKKEALDAEKAKIFFDALSTARTKEGFQNVETFKYIPDTEFKPTKEFIELEKGRLARLSRAELLEEVKRKNEKLIKLLDELKVRAEKEKELAAQAAAAAAEKKRANELQKAKELAESLVEDLEDEKKKLENARLILKRSNQELEEFSYVVSHDLKAPLRGVSSLSEWIATDYADKLDEDGKKKLDLLGIKVRRMNDLISGILEYSRIGRSAEEHVKVDFNDLLKDTVKLMEIPENIEIKVADGLPTLVCDKIPMEQVFLNLLNNAVKYMDKPKGEICVGCAENGTYWEFSITDNGPGIEERHFDRIFKLFQTLESRDKTKSTGVGLSLVKRIINMQGGEIWVKSEMGKGATFYFTVPKVQKRKKKIGELLVENGAISQEKIDEKLKDQEKSA